MTPRPVMMITGAAHGLGQALARRAAHDYRLVLVDRARRAGQALADALRREGAEVFFCEADVSRDADLRRTLERVQRRWERLDVLINNAGIAAVGPFEALQPDSWEALWRINVMGTVNGCRAALPMMKRQGSGYLVNVAALAGISAPPGMASYAASNAAIIRLSETLAAELASLNIQVSVACPDLFPSEMSRHMPSADALSRARLDRGMKQAPDNADQVAERILKAMARQPLYIFPQPEALRTWRRKRRRPARFARGMALLGRRLRRYSTDRESG